MRNWKRDARVIYLRYRKSRGNIRCKSAIVDLCEMKRTRYIGNNLNLSAIYRYRGKYPREFVPDCPRSGIRQLFPTMNEMSCPRRTLIYIRIPGVPRVNARVLMQIHGRYLADRDSSYVGRVTRNCRTYIHGIRAGT